MNRDVQNLRVAPADDALAALRASGTNGIGLPSQKSQDIIAALNSLVTSLGSDFAAEMKQKSEALDRARAQLQVSTKELAEQRQSMGQWKAKVAEKTQLEQRIKNLERALGQEHAFDWSGRSEANGAYVADPMFAPVSGSIPVPPSTTSDPEPEPTNSMESLVRLRRMAAWYDRALQLLRQRMEHTRGSSLELEARYKKVVAAFCGLPVDKVDTMLDQLLAAVESDGERLDMGRVSHFMSAVSTRGH